MRIGVSRFLNRTSSFDRFKKHVFLLDRLLIERIVFLNEICFSDNIKLKASTFHTVDKVEKLQNSSVICGSREGFYENQVNFVS